jgi:chorismate mutase/prephenate dehydratase
MSNLDDLRKKIDSIDRNIIDHLNERVQLAFEIGRLKSKSGAEIYNPTREQQVLEQITKLNKGPLDESSIHFIYREIISAATALQKRLIVAYLGPEATFTHQAAIKNFGSSLDYRPLNTIVDVIIEVERGDADYGVFPIENSTGGSVNNSQEILADTELKIISQVYLKVEHCLISNSAFEDINEVYSKDQAFNQCRDWLRRNLPNAALIDVSSTSKGVQIARDKPGAAAIASIIASEIHRVPVLKENIQDSKDNMTRFLVIGKTAAAALGEGKDKTSLVFSIKDEVGGLQKALESFSRRNINLVKIESRPSRRKAWDYYFYVDFLGHIEEPLVKEAMEDLEEHCPFVKWLGSYPMVEG